MRPTRREFTVMLGALLAGGALRPVGRSAWAQATASPRQSTFEILRKGKRIGHHRIALEPRGADLVARTEIDLQVKLLFITLADMRHRSEERWRAGRLVELRSRTEDGNETYEVAATLAPEGLRVRSQADDTIAPPDVGSSNAVWHPDMLQRRQLVDAQHGGVIGLVADRQADDEITVGDRRLSAVRYRAITPNVAGHLWYAENRLVQARLEVHGQTVDYRLVV